MTVKLSSWIEQIPEEPGLPSPGPAKEIEIEIDNFEDRWVKLAEALPKGWRLMNIGVER